MLLRTRQGAWISIRIRCLAFALGLLISGGAQAACLTDLGRKSDAAFGPRAWAAALVSAVRDNPCHVYGIVWSSAENDRTRHLLLFSVSMASVVHVSFAEGRREQTFAGESWSGVTRNSLLSNSRDRKFDKRYYTVLKAGESWVIDEPTADFLKQNSETAAFAGDDGLGTFAMSAEDAALAAAAYGEGDVEPGQVATPPAPPLPVRSGEIAHARCINELRVRGGSVSSSAQRSLARCEGELRKLDEAREVSIPPPTPAPARQEAAVTPPTPPPPMETEPAPAPPPPSERKEVLAATELPPSDRTKAIERRMAQTKDLDELHKLANQIPVEAVQKYWLDVISDKERRLHACLEQLQQLNVEPSDASRKYEEDCDWQLFAVRARQGRPGN